MSWEKKKFIDFILLQRGHDLTKEQIKLGIYPVVTSTSIMGYHNAYKAEGPGVITGRSGTIGEVQYVEENYWPHNTSLYVKDFKGNYPKFVYYFMKNFGTDRVKGGSAVPTLNRNNLSGIDVYIPDFESQQRIASVLEKYDDIIENNQKQIKLLEEAAQRLYKEWFINLRFPGYEGMEIIDDVPEGWSRKKVVDCLEMYIGGGWGKETIVGKNTIPGKVIRGTDINDIKSGVYNDVPLRYHTENDKNKRALKPNDIVFELSNGNIDNIGRSLLIDDLILKNCGDNTICASFCKLFRPIDRRHSLVLYLEIQDMQSSGRMMPYKKQGSNGINNFAFEDFLEHMLLVPGDYSILATFEDIISKISILQNQLSLLIQARDRLLPKLMSGEIEV